MSTSGPVFVSFSMDTNAVNPLDIPIEPLSRPQLQDWLVFSVCVANKEATQTRRKVDKLWNALHEAYPHTYGQPFEAIAAAHKDGVLGAFLSLIKTGQYQRIEKAFVEMLQLDLDNLTVEALEAVHGIGPKTARMIMLYHKPGIEVVPLDTHVLKYLRKLGYEDVPKNTPPAGKTYAKWERIFIEEAAKARMTVREFDTYVWQMYAIGFKNAGVPRG